MQSIASLVFFIVFALVQLGMYILVRRRIGSTMVVAVLGVVISVACIALMTLAQGNTPLWAAVVGVLLGGLFSTVSLAAAWYFSTSESRRARFDPYAVHDMPDQDNL
jgi:hypothetical protein